VGHLTSGDVVVVVVEMGVVVVVTWHHGGGLVAVMMWWWLWVDELPWFGPNVGNSQGAQQQQWWPCTGP